MAVPHVVEVAAVKADHLERLWRQDERVWAERLCWDRADLSGRLWRAVADGSLSGKVLQVEDEILGCTLYQNVGPLGLLSNFVVSSECRPDLAAALLQETVHRLRRAGASRIETSFISYDLPWLCPLFERQGFRTYWREFLRHELRLTREPSRPPANVRLEVWRRGDVREAASIMLTAYKGSIDAEMNEQCRTQSGCELELDDIQNQGICGSVIPEASAVARHRGQGIGFIMATAVGPRQAHVAEIAVLPKCHRQGIGRLLLEHLLTKLADSGYTTVSLFVSRLNRPAVELYNHTGFQHAWSYPVFVWQG